MDHRVVSVVNGGVEQTTLLLQQKFDHIFFTGSISVGKIVYKAAVESMCPVVLELGGKSPVYVDKDMDPRVAAKRILWAKTLNSGQTCIAPDYILCHEDKIQSFVAGLQLAQSELFGQKVKESRDYSRIVNSGHFDRLRGVLVDQLKTNPKCKVVMGGINGFDKDQNFIPPTVITGVQKNDPIMDPDCEIFGPILPIVSVSGHQEAIDFVNNQRDLPLALYVFSRSDTVARNILDATNSGCAMVNDIMMNMAVHDLPFGGVGASGIGAYHGKAGFETFTHKRSVLKRPAGFEFLNEVRYSPFSKLKMAVIQKIIKKPIPSRDLPLFAVAIKRFIRCWGSEILVAAAALALGFYAGRKENPSFIPW
ncbi:MAG: hypothetical protein SGCHY_005538 [Lobulomycetales sp.]